MGFTTIHSPSQLLRNAGSEKSLSAQMPDVGRNVHLKGHFFEQEELDTFASVLRDARKDIWLTHDNQRALVAGRADDPVEQPTVVTTVGVQDHRSAVHRVDEPEDATPKPPLAYVIVVRGRSAALSSKVRIFYKLKAASAAMFEEAANGYSTVFSAAILRADVARLDGGSEGLRKVDTINQLYESAKGGDKAIALLCGGGERFSYSV